MKVLFIYPPIRAHEIAHRFPTGLGYLCAILKNAGIEVDALDLNMERMTDKKLYSHFSDILGQYDVVGIGGLVTVYNAINSIIDIVKEIDPTKPVIVGGPIATYSSNIIIEHTKADIVVLGEAEERIIPLLETICSDGDLSKIKGLCYREGGEIKSTPQDVRMSKLDDIPFPSYTSFDMESYVRNFGTIRGKRAVNMIASRGCPFTCTFCARNFGTGITYRSVGNVLEEIEMLIANWSVEEIHFNDELFTADKKWVHNFCDEVIKRGLNLRFTATGKPNCVNKELLVHMKEAGFRGLMHGVESFNTTVLKELNKRHTKEQIVQAIEWSREVGIHMWPGFIIGMPGESFQSVRDTVELCKKYDFPLDDYYFVTPYPGTALYEDCKANGIIKDEVAFIKAIDDADITKFSVNMSPWSDSELTRIRGEAMEEVRQYRAAMNPAPPQNISFIGKVLTKSKSLLLGRNR